MGILGGYDFRSVRAFINERYNEKYDAFLFELEDFGFDNIVNFEYRIYSDRKLSYYDFEKRKKVVLGFDGQIRVEDKRFFVIFLKEIGETFAKEAIAHLSNLDFVKTASFNAQGIKPGIFITHYQIKKRLA